MENEGAKKKKRYYLIDSYRGFVILHMVLYHFCYDVFVLQNINPEWIDRPFAVIWQQFICMSFIIVAGISASFSRNLLKRGLWLNAVGFGITLVTVMFSPDAPIYFGILNLLGCSLLIMIVFRRWIGEKNWKWWGIACILLFMIFRHIQSGYLGIGQWKWIEIPDVLYEWGWLTPFGILGRNFFSADFFPIFPWFFLFLLGYCLSYLIKKERVEKMMTFSIPGLWQLGQKSLIIYLVHQPIALVISEMFF